MNFELDEEIIDTVDVGRAMFTHSFGAFFGIGLCISTFCNKGKK